MTQEATTNYQNLMLHNVTRSAQLIPLYLWDSITWDLIIRLIWLLVGMGKFVSVGIYHTRASLLHRLSRCPVNSNFQLACCFQT